MTKKEKLFVLEYLETKDVEVAYLNVFGDRNDDKAFDLFCKKSIQNYLTRLKLSKLEKQSLKVEEVLSELSKMGLSNYTDYIEENEEDEDEKYKIKDLKNLNPNLLPSIKYISAKGDQIYLYDKLDSLKELLKYHSDMKKIESKNKDLDIKDFVNIINDIPKVDDNEIEELLNDEMKEFIDYDEK